MGDSKLFESLDSLWFFSNVLALRPEPMAACRDSTFKEEDDQPKPIITSIVQNEAPNAEPITPQRCQDLAAGDEPLAKKFVQLPSEGKVSKTKKRRGRRTTRRRKILGDDDDRGLGGKNSCYKDYNGGGDTCGYAIFGGQVYQVCMPPLRDGFAMKQHLKSWAHAVACTVR